MAVQEVLTIDVEYSTADAEPIFVATNDQIGLVTDGATFEALLENLKEAIAVCLEDTDTVQLFNLVPNPRIELRMLLPESYAPAS